MTLDGVYSVLPTAFSDSGDLPSQRTAVDRLISTGNGRNAPAGTAEAARLDDQDRATVLETVIGKTSRVASGAAARGSRACIASSRQARPLRAAAVVVGPTRMATLTADVVERRYKALAESVDHPIVVQESPTISGFARGSVRLARLARGLPFGGAIRLEDPPTPLGPGCTLEQTGAVAGCACLDMLVRTVSASLAGQADAAAGVFSRAVSVTRFELQEAIGVAIRQAVRHLRGALARPATRGHTGAMDPFTNQAFDRVPTWITTQKGFEWISV